MPDNRAQFASIEFKEFSRQYRFSHITSSPHCVQANGFIECMAQTVKMSMKCLASGHDFNWAMLVYRAHLSPTNYLHQQRCSTTESSEHYFQCAVCKLLIKEKLYMTRCLSSKPDNLLITISLQQTYHHCTLTIQCMCSKIQSQYGSQQ